MSATFSHFLVPEHSIATEDELKKLYADFQTSEDKLPHILDSDPAIAELGAKAGDVIRCARQSPVTGKIENYYRRVIESK
ncbi:MAG: DNA-directed RNA polymerase subunit H [Candidatus Micrarchaeia archaeon]|jgi:DNA-directed RNA polymerase subunit H (RpoH/RPB5)